MREIKFRAWDRGVSKMQELIGYALPLPNDTGTDNPNRNMVYMQYIGLKDKNGREIYEGDILHTDFHGDDGLSCNFVVEYEPATGFIGDKTRGQNPRYCAVVIGNIWENPELLAN